MKILKFCVILVSFLYFTNNCYADDNAAYSVKTIKELSSVPKKNLIKPSDRSGQYSIETAILHSKENNQNIELSVISLDTAREMYQKITKDKNNHYDFINEGTEAHALRMVQVLEIYDITAGKVMIEGNFFYYTKYGDKIIEWRYRVAPIVMIKIENKIIPYVIDPGIFKEAVSYEEWRRKILQNQQSKLTAQYFTNRYAYDPIDKNKIMDDYDSDLVFEALGTLEENRAAVFVYNEAHGIKN